MLIQYCKVLIQYCKVLNLHVDVMIGWVRAVGSVLDVEKQGRQWVQVTKNVMLQHNQKSLTKIGCKKQYANHCNFDNVHEK